eukprot:scaffold177215_cov27-Tisochrysis_lutea.AAC.4
MAMACMLDGDDCESLKLARRSPLCWAVPTGARGQGPAKEKIPVPSNVPLPHFQRNATFSMQPCGGKEM